MPIGWPRSDHPIGNMKVSYTAKNRGNLVRFRRAFSVPSQHDQREQENEYESQPTRQHGCATFKPTGTATVIFFLIERLQSRYNVWCPDTCPDACLDSTVKLIQLLMYGSVKNSILKSCPTVESTFHSLKRRLPLLTEDCAKTHTYEGKSAWGGGGQGTTLEEAFEFSTKTLI